MALLDWHAVAEQTETAPYIPVVDSFGAGTKCDKSYLELKSDLQSIYGRYPHWTPMLVSRKSENAEIVPGIESLVL